MIFIITRLFQLVIRYQLWEDEDWKILSQNGGCALSGQAAEAWADQVKNAGAPPNRGAFKSLLQEFGKQYFGRKAAEDQKDAMENGVTRGCTAYPSLGRIFES